MLVGKGVARDDRVDLAGLKGDGARCRIGNDAVDNAVQKRSAFLEIIFIADQRDVAAFVPFLKLERSAADRLIIVARILEHVGAFIEMLGHDAAVVGSEHFEKGRVSFFEADLDRRWSRRLDRLDAAVGFAAARVVFADEVLEAELYIR